MYRKKNFILTLVWASLLVTNASKAQTIPNFDFQDWSKISAQTLANWKFQGQISKDSFDANNAGVRLLNDTLGSTSLFQIGNRFPDKYNGGFSISGTPTAIKIDYRSDNLLSDTALVIFGCTRTGDSLPIVLQQFHLLPGQGSNSTFAQANITLNYAHPTPGLIADSAFLVVYSSLRIKKPNNSGFLSLFNIQLSNNQILQEKGNLTFENWPTLSVESPQKWHTSHLNYYNNNRTELSSFQLSTKYFNGLKNNLELKSNVVTKGSSQDTIAAWAITQNLTDPTFNINKPSFPITSKPGAMQIDWTGLLENGDRFTATINFFRGDTVIGSGTFSKSAFNYNQNAGFPTIENIEWLPNYTDFPEYATVMVWLTDSSFATQSTLASFVRISKITLLPFGLNTAKSKKHQTIDIYPNPASKYVRIHSADKIAFVSLINSAGQIVWHNASPIQEFEIPNHLSNGNYWLNIGTNNGTFTKPIQILR